MQMIDEPSSLDPAEWERYLAILRDLPADEPDRAESIAQAERCIAILRGETALPDDFAAEIDSVIAEAGRPQG